MPRIVVLGGAGGIGSVAVRALVTVDDFDEIVVADRALDTARALVDAIDRAGMTAAVFDAAAPDSIAAAVTGADVVLNCVGPFYRFGPPILEAVIRAGIDYVDVCDDLDATIRMLDMHDAAERAGVTAVIGMGNSPGLANVFVRLCAEHFLDTVESVDIMHIHGGEPEEGPAVVKHRIHAMTNDVPLFVDGAFVKVRMLEPTGRAFVQETEFRDVGTYPVYPYPHPETITLPRNLSSLRRVTNLGVVFPLPYFQLTMDMVRLGLCGDGPLTVDGHEIAPIDFTVAHILAERPRLLAEAGVDGPSGCLKVVVGGRKDGAPHTYVCSLSSGEQGAGEGTGIPAALGAILVHRGKVDGPGVLPPEAAVPPDDLLALVPDVITHFGMGAGMPIHLDHVGPDGTREESEVPG